MFHGQLPEASNREDYEYLGQFIDDDTGEAADITSASITFEVKDDRGTCVIASTGNGMVTLVENDTFYLLIPKSSMSNLRAGTYELGATVLNAGITKQLIAGSLPVIDGIVS